MCKPTSQTPRRIRIDHPGRTPLLTQTFTPYVGWVDVPNPRPVTVYALRQAKRQGVTGIAVAVGDNRVADYDIADVLAEERREQRAPMFTGSLVGSRTW